MNCVVGQIQKEGLALIGLDEFYRLIGQAVGKIFTFFAAGNFINRKVIIISVRIKIRRWKTSFGTSDIYIEALIFRQILFAAKMPFTDGCGSITGSL